MSPFPETTAVRLRAIVPGYAGVRNVKWVQRVKLSSEEAQGAWQRGMNYKAMPSHWRTKQDLQGVDFSQLPSIHELPVQCAFSSPAPGDHYQQMRSRSKRRVGPPAAPAGRFTGWRCRRTAAKRGSRPTLKKV